MFEVYYIVEFQEFMLWDGELAFIDSFIDSDVRNNSAWNHRYFVITHTDGLSDNIVKREIEYVYYIT